jgi:hypothetical protein
LVAFFQKIRLDLLKDFHSNATSISTSSPSNYFSGKLWIWDLLFILIINWSWEDSWCWRTYVPLFHFFWHWSTKLVNFIYHEIWRIVIHCCQVDGWKVWWWKRLLEPKAACFVSYIKLSTYCYVSWLMEVFSKGISFKDSFAI